MTLPRVVDRAGQRVGRERGDGVGVLAPVGRQLDGTELDLVTDDVPGDAHTTPSWGLQKAA